MGVLKTNPEQNVAPSTAQRALAHEPPQEEKGAIGIAFLVWLLGGGLGLAVVVFLLLKIF